MSKIRIYELAKELGVDNRVVIDLASEIGVSGKLSHSNSLDAGEADQIRRAVIRQAIGATPESEKVTTRVNRATGSADTIVESRKGNVIRRRKRDETDEPTPETVVEAQAVEPVEELDTVEELFEEPVVLEPEVDGEEPVAEQPVVEAVVEVAEGVVKKTVGPRVLGRIELPVKRKIEKPVAKKGIVAKVATATVEEEEDEEGNRKKSAVKRKGKKREFSRTDLVDYEGHVGRKTGRGKGARGRDSEAEKPQAEANATRASKKVVKLTTESISVGELARQMSLKVGEIIGKLMELGIMATINQAIDKDTATLMAEEYGYHVESTGFVEEDVLSADVQDDPATLKARPPVVTVMGHVDHGKTTLLDSIRHTAVAAREHGGITQHIGAYSVKLDDGRMISFIDTPGHAAFTTMRARGAQITDIVVLVVAADDGVMPQTVEAINHAKAAGVPVVVAVNKIDRPNINQERIRQQLAEHGLQPEDWGGDTMFFNISALNGTGIKELLEGILLQAEVKELRANPDRRAMGAVIEARQDKGRGTVATILVKNGSLRVSDVFVAGGEWGKIRSMLDYTGKQIEVAGPSTPVEITGFSGVPLAGDDFFVVESEASARQVASSRLEKRLARERLLTAGPVSLEEFSRRANEMTLVELNIILKADVHGSVEAVRTAIENLSTEKVRVRVLHAAVGGVTESDVQLAIASKALIVGFGVRADQRVTTEAENASIEIRFYRIIYELIDDVKLAMAGLLAPVKSEVHLGRVEVRDTFAVSKVGTVAGCYVLDGMVKRGAFLRLLRDSRVIHEGRMSTLKRFKDDVREVQTGYECGIGIAGYNDVKTGDVMEVYEVQETAATL